MESLKGSFHLKRFHIIFFFLCAFHLIFGSYQSLGKKFNILTLFVSNLFTLSVGKPFKGGNNYPTSPPIIEKLRRKPIRQRPSDAPVLCTGCGLKTEPDIRDSMKFSFSEIQLATNDFSKDNLLGEGGYGHVYRGRLKDGQHIAAKVRKEASTQGFAEFHSEIYVLSFARHKNIVMLLGYCCKENLNILVYEYICNKSLEWHLFGEFIFQ